MTVTVLVPVSDDRRAAWEPCRRRWEHYHPEWPIVEVPASDPWSKGATLNPAIDAHDGVLVLADCDLMADPDAVRAAATLAETAPWVVPFRWLYRLGPTLTAEATAWPLLPTHPVRKRDGLEHRSTEGKPGGGLVVARAEVLRDVGGFDPRFVGWGREDISLGVALDTLAGRHERVESHLWHLHHPRAQARHTEARENLRLAGRYEDARDDPATMRALIEEAA